MNIHTVFHIPTLHGKIFEGIFPMWKFAKLLPSKQTKSNLTFTIYCPNFGGNYNFVKHFLLEIDRLIFGILFIA